MIPVLFLFFAFLSGIVLVLDKRKSTEEQQITNKQTNKQTNKSGWFSCACLLTVPHLGVGGQTSTLLSQTSILGAGDTLVEELYVNLTFLYSIAQVRFFVKSANC